jgi:hypothetical protein
MTPWIGFGGGHQGISVSSPSPTYYLVVEFFVARRGVTRGSRAVLGLAKT